VQKVKLKRVYYRYPHLFNQNHPLLSERSNQIFLVFIFSTFIVFLVYVFVCLGQLLAQFECTALLSCPLHMHVYMFLCFVHGQIKWWWWWLHTECVSTS